MRLQHVGHSRAEHLADGIVHAFGVVLAILAAVVLLNLAQTAAPGARSWPLIVYAIGLLATFGFSAAYNMTHHAGLRAFLRRFDHAAIFLMIAGTYTPVALIGLGGNAGWFLVIGAWSIAIIGIFLKIFFFHSAYRAVFFLYLLQGWLALIVIVPVSRALSPPILLLIALGGVVYTLGTIVHHRENWAYNRAIWHGFVLSAAMIHFAAVFSLASGAGA